MKVEAIEFFFFLKKKELNSLKYYLFILQFYLIFYNVTLKTLYVMLIFYFLIKVLIENQAIKIFVVKTMLK